MPDREQRPEPQYGAEKKGQKAPPNAVPPKVRPPSQQQEDATRDGSDNKPK